MLLRYLEVLGEAPLAFVMLLGAFVFSMVVGLSFHEFSHALAATALGDRTPARYGRLTLNPKAHLDPVGSVLILLAGFGWAKPTPVNPNNARNPRQALALISVAGPVSNLALAGVAAVPIKLAWVPPLGPGDVYYVAEALTVANLLGLFLGSVVLLNVILAVFNLIPVAPLDGFKIVLGLLPRDLSRAVAPLEAWGPGILMLLIVLPWITNGAMNPLFDVMAPVLDFFLDAFLGSPTPF